MATIILLLLSTLLTQEQFLDWGWRVAFWFSAVVVLIGLWIRKSVDDAPVFKEAQRQQALKTEKQLGIVEVLKYHKKAIVAGIGTRFVENILYYIVVTFSISYLKLVVHKDTTEILVMMFGAHFIHVFFIPLMGHLSDVYGRKPIFVTGAVLTATWGFFAFPMMDTGHDGIIMLAIIIGLFFQSMTYSPYSALMTELFPTHVRYTALSLCYQIAPILAGSWAPLISLALLDHFNSSVPISIYLVCASLISIISISLIKETKGRSLSFDDK